MKVTVLNENTAGLRGFLAEHGLSLLLEQGERRWLFDTGQSRVFLSNAARMGIDLLHLDGIILSHGHFDHCGGLQYLVEEYQKAGLKLPPVYVRERAFLDKTALNSDKISYRHIGIPWKKELIASAIHLTRDKEQIADQTWLLGNIPYTVGFERRPKLFFIGEGENPQPDYMEDEQMLLMRTERGLCVFAGCCHAGIMNCLEYIKASFPGEKLYSVFAGMHLSGAREERVLETIDALAQMDLELLIPAHCTGIEAIGRMKARFGAKCILVETGKVFELE